MADGIRSNDLPLNSVLDELIGNADVGLSRQTYRASFQTIAAQVASYYSLGSLLVYNTRAELYADLTPAANVQAQVVADTDALNGVYKKNGASGTGSWTRVSDLVIGFYPAMELDAAFVTTTEEALIEKVGTRTAPILRMRVPKGSAWYAVNGTPSSTLGGVGDFAIDRALFRIWGPKTNLGWGASIDVTTGVLAQIDLLRQEIADAREIFADAVALTGVMPRVSRSGLKALDVATVQQAVLTELGREGIFVWEPTSAGLVSHLEVQQLASSSGLAATDQFTSNFHQLDTGSGVYTKIATADLAAFRVYFVIRTGVSTFKLANTFADALAGTAIDLTASQSPTFFRHADPHEGIYVIPNGRACDGSQGAWRRVNSSGQWSAALWPISTSIAHNQGVLTTALTAMRNGEILFIPAGTYPVSRYTWLRWREGQTVRGAGNRTTILHGDGTASSIFRVSRDGCVIENIGGGNFSGQVPGELTANDANLSESSGVHAFPMEAPFNFDGGTGDQLTNITVQNCYFYDVDSGVSVSANHFNDAVNGITSRADIGYYTFDNAFILNNTLVGIRRQGVELFLTQKSQVANNNIVMGPKGVGFSTSRAVRLVGCVQANVIGNHCIGYDETTAGTLGISIESASMSLYDDPAAVRFAGKIVAVGNQLENFESAFQVNGVIGASRIADNIVYGNATTKWGSTTLTRFIRILSGGYSEGGADGAVTISLANPAVVTWTGFHRVLPGDVIRLFTDGALPAPIINGGNYFALGPIADNAPFQISATDGGAPIDTSGSSQSGTHRAENFRFRDSKNQVDNLVIEGNQAIGVALFGSQAGKVISVEVTNNFHVGNSNTTSTFWDVANINDIPNDERCDLCKIVGNTSVTNGLRASGSVVIANNRAGEIYYVDGNYFSGGTPASVVTETGVVTGTISIGSSVSNTRLPASEWTTFSTLRGWGPIDKGVI